MLVAPQGNGSQGGMSNSMMPWMAGAAGGAGLGGLLSMLFGGNDFQNPANAAMPYLNQIPDELKQYLNPYIQQGQSVFPQLQNTYSSLMNDPSQIYNKIGSNYKSSPGYQFQLGQAMNAGNNAAAAGGMLGGPQNQQINMDTAQGLASRDYENYMNHNLGLFGQGLQGEQGIYNTGFQASNDLASALAQAMMSQASMAGRGAEAQNQYDYNQQQSMAQLFGNVGGSAAAMIPFL